MSFLSKFKSLFARPSTEMECSVASESYQGYEITTEQMEEGGQYRVCGWIRKGTKEHRFIRADVLSNWDACVAETFRKAKLLIDQQCDGLFK